MNGCGLANFNLKNLESEMHLDCAFEEILSA